MSKIKLWYLYPRVDLELKVAGALKKIGNRSLIVELKELVDYTNRVQLPVDVMNGADVASWKDISDMECTIDLPNLNFVPSMLIERKFTIVSKRLYNVIAGYCANIEAIICSCNLDEDYRILRVLNVEDPIDYDKSEIDIVYPLEEAKKISSHSYDNLKDHVPIRFIDGYSKIVIREDFYPKEPVFIDRMTYRICVTEDVAKSIVESGIEDVDFISYTERFGDSMVWRQRYKE